jgi:NAD(P)-dependent dehydrogenase (short-subunit alcohol dehydrogenase family)
MGELRPMKDFGGRVAVVTGAASGIGQALAHRLAREGCALALVDIDEAGLARTRILVEGEGRHASVHVVDVSDRAKMEALPDAVVRAHGRVDVLVNNAGVAVAGTLEEQSLEDFEWIVGINFWGVVYGCKFFLPVLRRSDDAYIVNLSSMFGLVGIPGQSSYCATKFAVRGLSEAIGAELHETSVRVMSVHPGGINTNIAKAGRYSDTYAKVHERVVKFFEKRTMAPTRCADIIVRGMKSNASRVLVTPEAHLTDALTRMFPRMPRSWIGKASKRFLQIAR